MILNRPGDSFAYNREKYTIGGQIIATSASEYEGPTGGIFEIRDGEDKETPDIYCCFEPPVLPGDIERLEKMFSELYQQHMIQPLEYNNSTASNSIVFKH